MKYLDLKTSDGWSVVEVETRSFTVDGVEHVQCVNEYGFEVALVSPEQAADFLYDEPVKGDDVDEGPPDA